jgi:hypothetical protein
MPFPLMTLRSLKLITLLSSMALPAMLLAQASSSEEERLERLMADSAQWYVPNKQITVGFRLLSAGGRVDYGNLGTVPLNVALRPLSEGEVSRGYNNGTVLVDGVRSNEKDADGNQITPDANGRYQTRTTPTDGSDPTVNGDFLSYRAGRTREWSYADASQVTADGRIAMSAYSATSDGAGATQDTEGSAGVEFAFTRTLGKLTQRAEWGISAGVALNSINNKTSGSVLSTLHTNTDYYSLNGLSAPAAPYAGPSRVDLVDASGTVITTNGLETTTPISSLPDGPTVTTSTVGGVTVNGNWQVKGAYFMVRLGPSVRARLTQRLGLNASVGIAGAYAGSTYSALESFAVPNIADTVSTQEEIEKSSVTKFLSGYYADLNLEWAATERTGLFGGVSAQQFGDYEQLLNGRTARIDLGSTVGLRGGVTVRF